MISIFFSFFKKILLNFLDPTVIFLYSSSLSLSLFFFFPSFLYSFLTLLLYLSHVFYIVTFVNVHGVDSELHIISLLTMIVSQRSWVHKKTHTTKQHIFFLASYSKIIYIYILLSPDKHHKVSSYFLETSYK